MNIKKRWNTKNVVHSIIIQKTSKEIHSKLDVYKYDTAKKRTCSLGTTIVFSIGAFNIIVHQYDRSQGWCGLQRIGLLGRWPSDFTERWIGSICGTSVLFVDVVGVSLTFVIEGGLLATCRVSELVVASSGLPWRSAILTCTKTKILQCWEKWYERLRSHVLRL